MLSTNWTRVRWGITPLAPCTNIKIYWSARHSCASSIRNYMSCANYAAINQIHVFSCTCIFTDVIIIDIIFIYPVCFFLDIIFIYPVWFLGIIFIYPVWFFRHYLHLSCLVFRHYLHLSFLFF